MNEDEFSKMRKLIHHRISVWQYVMVAIGVSSVLIGFVIGIVM